MIQLADGLGRFLQPLVIAQPLAHLRNLLAMDAELPGAATRIADGQNGLRVSFTAGALGATAGVTCGALDQRAAQDFACEGKTFEDSLTSLDGLLIVPSANSRSEAARTGTNFRARLPIEGRSLDRHFCAKK